MAPHDSDALCALLEEGVALPPGARAAFLDEACTGRDELREELISLLAAHDAASDYFERVTEQIIGPALVAFADDVEVEFSIGRTIAQYRLLERLGSGGMGVVFKALDLRLDRFVALKFLTAPLSSNPIAKERLVAEAKAASALDHPNIGVVHDIGQTNDGRHFIVMGYYEGETLELKNERGGMSVRDAIDVVTQIANALTAAHQKGIIHRDVKPSNILITKEGTAKLLDFGIAKLADSNVTKEGAAAGTVAYMSPEQTRGDTIDQRTDLWSLGVVLYELLAGVRPFSAENDESLVFAIRHDEWRPVAQSNAKISVGITKILDRCLAKDPADRYADARELLADLRALDTSEAVASERTSVRRRRSRVARYVEVAAVLGVLGLAGIYLGQRSADVPRSQRNTPYQSPQNRLAVLPLVSVSSAAAESDLADGLTEELITHLSNISGLRVIARSSIMQYKGSGKNPSEIGRELAVRAILAGRLRTTTDHVQVTLQLVDANNQAELWTKNYQGALADLQTVQRDVGLHVARSLGVQLQNLEERRLSQIGTTSSDAYLLYLKGRRFLEKHTVEAAKQAQEYFEQALDLDPPFAKAWVGLGEAFSSLAALAAMRAGDAYPRSKAAAERALEFDPDLSEAHVCLATALSAYYWDFDRAAHHYRRALELNSSDADAHRLYSEHLRFNGRFDEALREARQAEELDPLSSASQIGTGIVLYWSRQYDEAIGEWRRILDVNPRFSAAYFYLALAHIQKHQYDRALEALNVPDSGGSLQRETLRGYIYAVTGRHEEARQVLERLQQLSPDQNISPWHSAIVHLGLGEHDRAMDLIEQAYQARDWQVRMLPVEPLLDGLRSHPRFRALLDKMSTNPRG
jgi:serine/threonine protein kinase/Tfp pilus assembly protein PilF